MQKRPPWVATLTLIILVCLLFNLLIAGKVEAQEAQKRRQKAKGVRMVEQNVQAPELYADNLSVKFTLVNMPGAETPDSNWEVSWGVYFISEADYWRRVRDAIQKQRSLSEPTDFPEKTLLAEGSFKKKGLAFLSERVQVTKNIRFKSRIPLGDQTKFASLMTTYTVKIYDGKLKVPIYRTGFFLTRPFDDDPSDQKKAIPRTTLYASFLVTPEGEVYASQRPRREDDTIWH